MNPYRPSPLLPVALLALALLASGCGDASEDRSPGTPTPLARQASPPPATPPAAPPEATTPADQAAATGAETPAAQLRRTVPMPRAYPKDAPVYPGTEPSQVIEKPNGQITVMFGTPDSPTDVMSFLADFLPGAGWEMGASQDLPNGQVIQGTKGDRRISLLISRVDEGRDSAITMIAVSVDS